MAKKYSRENIPRTTWVSNDELPPAETQSLWNAEGPNKKGMGNRIDMRVSGLFLYALKGLEDQNVAISAGSIRPDHLIDEALLYAMKEAEAFSVLVTPPPGVVLSNQSPTDLRQLNQAWFDYLRQGGKTTSEQRRELANRIRRYVKESKKRF